MIPMAGQKNTCQVVATAANITCSGFGAGVGDFLFEYQPPQSADANRWEDGENEKKSKLGAL